MAKIKTAEVKTEKKKAGFMEVVTAIWFIAITAVFPLYFQDAYADILNAKYGFMLVADGLFLAAFIVWALIAGRPKKYIASMKACADPETGKWFGNWFKQAFNWLDIFMLAFLVIVIISTLQASPYIYQAIFGNEGRWVGTITLVLWCLTFFVASRYLKLKSGYTYAFLGATLIVSLWAITDYFDMDILNFKYYSHDAARATFVSTIGNIDAYNGFAAIPMAFAGIMYIFSKKGIISRIFFWICFAAALTSMITSSADNAYLSFAVFFAFAPLAATKTKSGIRRYIITLATFITAIKLVGYMNESLEGIVLMSGNTLVDICAELSVLWWIAGILWAAAMALFIYDVLVKKCEEDTPAPKVIHTAWIIILIAGIVGLIVVFVYANITVNANKQELPALLEPFRNYLVFSDEWGTWRGYVWNCLMHIYPELPFIHKVFGTGPETSAIYLYNIAYFNVANATGFLYDNPHNEWLLMFFNLGPFGLISYLCVFISPVVMAFRRNVKKYYPIVLAVGFVCICHLAESFINTTSPMDLPVIFALMALAQSLFRTKE